jgi:neurofibromin 1
VLTRLLISLNIAPSSLRNFAHDLRELAVAKFEKSGQIAVGSLIFLRFLCPALLFPDEWSLLRTNLSNRVSRNLVMIAKVLQNLGNGLEFAKEEFMICMNDFIKEYLPLISVFFDEFASEVEADHPYRDVEKAEVDASMNELTFLMDKMQTLEKISIISKPSKS